ncbi:unnamed protein product [Pocillopora meandrina]|uniref:DUF4371 domain-containing protein n=1 Tax=Pocillopora meandrina TaxID=46732 RepID=A0AAU9XZI6_9CNID|nr:unnamed protein product [Pocillopora meandrina]
MRQEMPLTAPKRYRTKLSRLWGIIFPSKIIAEVKQTRMFSVMADEAADISNKENLSLLLVPVLSTLENVKLNMDKNGVVRAGTLNPKSRDNARSLLNAVTFEFIVTLGIVKYILNLTRPLLSC